MKIYRIILPLDGGGLRWGWTGCAPPHPRPLPLRLPARSRFGEGRGEGDDGLFSMQSEFSKFKFLRCLFRTFGIVLFGIVLNLGIRAWDFPDKDGA